MNIIPIIPVSDILSNWLKDTQWERLTGKALSDDQFSALTKAKAIASGRILVEGTAPALEIVKLLDEAGLLVDNLKRPRTINGHPYPKLKLV